MKKYLMMSILVILFSITYFPQSEAASSLGKTCLNEDGLREFDFRYTVGVQEFDELNKQVYVTINFDAEDEEEQTEPFEVFHRRYPYLGAQVIHVIEKNDNGYYDTEANQQIHERRITPIMNFPINLWPFETYKIPMFLEFDKDAKLCYQTFDDGSSDIHAYKAGYFPENPDWNVSITAHEITLEQMKKIVPDVKPKFENSTIFQFDTVISHTDDYILKNGLYVVVPLVPILLIIGHGFFIRFENVNIHITFFAGVSILILTSLFAIRPSTPIDITLLETVSLSSTAAYAIGFFVFLIKRHRKHFKMNKN